MLGLGHVSIEELAQRPEPKEGYAKYSRTAVHWTAHGIAKGVTKVLPSSSASSVASTDKAERRGSAASRVPDALTFLHQHDQQGPFHDGDNTHTAREKYYGLNGARGSVSSTGSN